MAMLLGYMSTRMRRLPTGHAYSRCAYTGSPAVSSMWKKDFAESYHGIEIYCHVTITTGLFSNLIIFMK